MHVALRIHLTALNTSGLLVPQTTTYCHILLALTALLLPGNYPFNQGFVR